MRPKRYSAPYCKAIRMDGRPCGNKSVVHDYCHVHRSFAKGSVYSEAEHEPQRNTVTNREIERVVQAASRLSLARDELDSAIRQAHAQGFALRGIAASAQMSHESVRRIISLKEDS